MENTKMVEFRKISERAIIVLDTKLVHLPTHLFKFQVKEFLGRIWSFFVILEVFLEIFKDFWDF